MRAWIIHSLYQLLRLAYYATGKAIYLSEAKSCFTESGEELAEDAKFGCLPLVFRKDIVDKIQPTIAYMGISTIIVAIMLDIAIYKWRKLTHLILYFELLYNLTVMTIPAD